MLKKFHEIKFYLNINKCEFYVNEIKYFDFIIITEKVKMNSNKIQTIFDWKTSSNIKNVQIFLNFVNFYKKFIVEYSKLIQSFIVLIKIEKKKKLFFHEIQKIQKKSFFFVKNRFYYRFDIATFWFEQKNINWIRRFWLSNNRNIVLKKRKRCFTFRNFYVTKNVVYEMQLRNLW